MTSDQKGVIKSATPPEPATTSIPGGVAVPQPLALIPTSAEFQGIPVRIVNVNGTQMMPVVDIARALKINRGSLTRSLKDKLFVGKTMACKVATPKGAQGMVCITSLGAVGLLYKINAEDVEDKKLGERIGDFQDFATKLVQKEMQVQAKLPVHEDAHPSGTVNEVMSRYMESARTAAREMGVPLDLAMAKALVLAGRDLHMDLTGYSRLLPAATTAPTRPPARLPAGVFVSDGYLSASEIAQRMNARNGGELRGKHINKFLKNYGFLYKNEEGRWCMTDLGAQYGRIFPFAASSGHVDYFIRWKPEVMQVSGMIRSD